MNEDLAPAVRLAVELLARAIHKEHADRLPGTAPFERCPHRADELTAGRRMAAGGMIRATYTVEAIGDRDAVDIAKRRARDEGLRILTVSRVVAVDPPSRTERTRWLVTLAVRP